MKQEVKKMDRKDFLKYGDLAALAGAVGFAGGMGEL